MTRPDRPRSRFVKPLAGAAALALALNLLAATQSDRSRKQQVATASLPASQEELEAILLAEGERGFQRLFDTRVQAAQQECTTFSATRRRECFTAVAAFADRWVAYAEELFGPPPTRASLVDAPSSACLRGAGVPVAAERLDVVVSAQELRFEIDTALMTDELARQTNQTGTALLAAAELALPHLEDLSGYPLEVRRDLGAIYSDLQVWSDELRTDPSAVDHEGWFHIVDRGKVAAANVARADDDSDLAGALTSLSTAVQSSLNAGLVGIRDSSRSLAEHAIALVARAIEQCGGYVTRHLIEPHQIVDWMRRHPEAATDLIDPNPQGE